MAETAAPLTMDTIVSLCRRRGFVFPSSEIYGGLGSTYDYGHYGVLTKNNIRSLWLRSIVQERDDIVVLDSAIILNPRVWDASDDIAGNGSAAVRSLMTSRQVTSSIACESTRRWRCITASRPPTPRSGTATESRRAAAGISTSVCARRTCASGSTPPKNAPTTREARA